MGIKKIVIHHSLTKDSGTVSWGAIREYHLYTKGWKDIGYHFGIEDLRGRIEILMGRMPSEKGSHCLGHNQDSLGVCFVGNFDLSPPEKENWDKGIELVRWLISVYGKDVQILGDNELHPNKSCPGKLFSMDAFRKDVFF